MIDTSNLSTKERVKRINEVIVRRAKNRNLIELDINSRRIFNVVLNIVKVNKYLRDTFSLFYSRELEKERQFEYLRLIEMRKCLHEILRTITDKEVKRLAILTHTTQNKQALKILKECFKNHQKRALFEEYYNNAEERCEEFKK